MTAHVPTLVPDAALGQTAAVAPRAASRLSIRLADSMADIEAVQRLRYRVFFEEMGACPMASSGSNTAPTPMGYDADAYDGLCDHLLVIDETLAEEGHAPADCVVGTYRLLRECVARHAQGFYSEAEFDLAPLRRATSHGGEWLELGRSCVLPAYRTSATISLLWRGIADYINAHRIGLMFGCASFAGTDPDAHAAALSYLHHHHRAPSGQRPKVRVGVSMERLAPDAYDPRQALFELPPLVKAYMRVGALFGDGAFIDHAFNTVDVFVILPVERIAGRYASRFSVAA